MLIAIFDTLFLVIIAFHCFSRAKFHDYQFAERDAFGSWGQAGYVPQSMYDFRVKKYNAKWHKWLWLMVVSLMVGFTFITSSAVYGQGIAVYGWILMGCGVYCVLIDPFISLIALEQNFLYLSETDKVNVRRFRIMKKNPNLLSFLLRCILLIATILIKIFIF